MNTESQDKLDIVVKEIEKAKSITPKGQNVKVYIAEVLTGKQLRLQELYDILYKLGDDEKILTLMDFPRYLLELDLDSYNYTDMITGEKIDPLKEHFSVKIHRSFNKWCADYWKLSHIEQTNQISKSPILLFDTMQFHPKLVEVSKSLFISANYPEAIGKVTVALIELVKQRTGYPKNKSRNREIDGKDLMSKAFNEEKPKIALNNLKSDADRDEQEGFRFLYIGTVVGIKNPKSHSLANLKDPYKALEYLSLISLLMKRAEEGKLIESEQTS